MHRGLKAGKSRSPDPFPNFSVPFIFFTQVELTLPTFSPPAPVNP